MILSLKTRQYTWGCEALNRKWSYSNLHIIIQSIPHKKFMKNRKMEKNTHVARCSSCRNGRAFQPDVIDRPGSEWQLPKILTNRIEPFPRHYFLKLWVWSALKQDGKLVTSVITERNQEDSSKVTLFVCNLQEFRTTQSPEKD